MSKLKINKLMEEKAGFLLTAESQVPTHKNGGSAGVRKSLFCSHLAKYWIRQESLIQREIWMKQDIYMVLSVSAQIACS